MLAIITNLLTNIPRSPHPHSYPIKRYSRYLGIGTSKKKLVINLKNSHLEKRAQTKPEDKCPPSPPKSIKL